MPEYNTTGNKPRIYPNWMSQVDSPTYKLTFYIVRPEIFNDPTRLLNDETATSNGDALIIAQSGTTTEYSIDNLLMLSRITANNKAGSTTTGIMQFDLVEVMGFKLLDRILRLAPFFGFKNMQSANYVLKIEFQGRSPSESKYTPYPGVFFYPLAINQITASVGPEGARYNIVAANIFKMANAESTVTSDITIPNVNNVSNFITSATKSLNEYEKNLRVIKDGDNPKPKKTWKVSLGETLSKSSVGDKTVRAQNWAWAGTVNADRAGGQSASSNPELRDVMVNGETNMTSWLAETFTANVPDFQKLAEREKQKGIRVPYIVAEPNVTYGEEIDPQTNQREVIIDLVLELKWTYTNADRDAKKQEKKLRDANFQTTRFLELPISKVYHYLFSGLNTEVMNFDLQFQQLFAVALDPGAGLNYGEASEVHAGTNLSNTKTQPSKSVRPELRFLSDIDVNQETIVMETPQYMFRSLKASKQQVNETKGETLTIEAIRDREYARRDVDFANVDIQIKGDPFWLGTPGATTEDKTETLVKYLNEDAMIVFLNYLPDTGVFDPESPKKGPLDMAASGVYRITEVENKFQGGQFTQKLTGYKDTNTSVYFVRDLMVMLEYNNRQ